MIKRYDMNVENMELASFGIGIYFYLDFMKFFARIFFLMSLTLGYIMVINFFYSSYPYVN